MAADGHDLSLTQLGRVERGERRLDTEDLVAIAKALSVTDIADLFRPPEGRTLDELRARMARFDAAVKAYNLAGDELMVAIDVVRGWVESNLTERPELAELIRTELDGGLHHGLREHFDEALNAATRRAAAEGEENS